MLDKIKSTFDDGLSKEDSDTAPKPDQPKQQQVPGQMNGAGPTTNWMPKIVTKPPPPPVVELPPGINLQGVLVGEDMHQAIINDQIVPLNGYIGGARLDVVNKEGVELNYKGKKFFLKID